MKKIIHLSDIHIGYKDCEQKFDSIVNNIISLFSPDEYLIVITGDTVNNANQEENLVKAKSFIKKLENKKFKVLIIPGNHDYGTGYSARHEHVRKFKEVYFGNANLEYPKVDIDDGIVFIGIDTNEEELHWYDRFFADGEIGRDQLSRLEAIINDGTNSTLKKVIYFHHHPIDSKPLRQLKDALKLKEIIDGKVNAMLFGHNHNKKIDSFRNLNGEWNIQRVYNAGSATHIGGTIGFHRVIDLLKPPATDCVIDLF
jgi:3',5'-cyclic AMP phosphodiesterase CpdA